MPNWRFIAFIIIAMFALPMYSMDIISLANQIGVISKSLGSFLKLSAFVGAMGGFFIHSLVCIIPVRCNARLATKLKNAGVYPERWSLILLLQTA